MVTSGKNDSNRFRFSISQLIVVYSKCFPSESYQQTRSMFSGRRSQTQDRLTLTLVRHHITQHCQSSSSSPLHLPSSSLPPSTPPFISSCGPLAKPLHSHYITLRLRSQAISGFPPCSIPTTSLSWHSKWLRIHLTVFKMVL